MIMVPYPCVRLNSEVGKNMTNDFEYCSLLLVY